MTDTANLRLSPPGAPPSPAPSCRPRRKWVALPWPWPGFWVLHSAGSPRPPFTDRHLVPFLPPAPLHDPTGWPLRAACGASACLSGSALPLFEHRPPLVRLPFCSASGLQFFFSRNPAASPLALETALGGCGPCVFPTAAVTSTTRWFRQTDRRLFSYSSGGEKPAVHLVGLTSRCRRAGPSGGSRGGSPHCCFQPPVAASIPWLAAASLESLPPWECGLFLWSSFPPQKKIRCFKEQQ